MLLSYDAPETVKTLLASLGRCEDVKFSPSARRLAIAAFEQGKIAVLDIAVAGATGEPKQIGLTDGFALASPHLRYPHGVDFLDEETIVVANRGGDACVFKLPRANGGRECEATPLALIGAAEFLSTPGSVTAIRESPVRGEILICNNFVHTVTRHAYDLSRGCTIGGSRVLLRKWLAVPDGIAVSENRKWIAVSNHDSGHVFLYENTPALNENSDPDGILRCIAYPHGVRFVADDRFIFAADAGAPYVNVYAGDAANWRGVRNPVLTFRVLDQDLFLRGRVNPMEGGPKGIDLAGEVMAVASELRELAFFDAVPVLQSAAAREAEARAVFTYPEETHRQDAFAVADELERLRMFNDAVTRAKQTEQQAAAAAMRADLAELQVASLLDSRSWRATAPLRWVSSGIRKLRNGAKGARGGARGAARMEG
jgi:hypothetical protein